MACRSIASAKSLQALGFDIPVATLSIKCGVYDGICSPIVRSSVAGAIASKVMHPSTRPACRAPPFSSGGKASARFWGYDRDYVALTVYAS